MTAKGQARIDLAKTRIERRQAAEVADDQHADPGKEEEKSAESAAVPFGNLQVPERDAPPSKVVMRVDFPPSGAVLGLSAPPAGSPVRVGAVLGLSAPPTSSPHGVHCNWHG